jgi:hypothetical protein
MALLPKVKLKAVVSFPATILDGTGIDVVKANGTYQFDIAYDDFAPPVGGISDPAHQNALLWNDITKQYVLAPVSLIGSGGSVPEAPNDGVQYGRQSLAWTPIASGGGGTPSNASPAMDGVAAPGVATAYSRGDHVHPSDTSRAPLASPVFTGNPQAPTPSPGDNDTSIATTAFVTAAVSASGGVVPSALTRVNDTNVTLTLGGTPNTALLQATSITMGWSGTLSAVRGGFGADVSAQSGVPLFATGTATFTGTTGTGNFVRATDPVLTGNPTAPTPTAGDNDTSIATTAFVTAAVAAGGAGTGAVRYDTAQSLTLAQKAQGRANTDALKRNYIANGAMMVSQENGATAGAASGYYPVDQFVVILSGTSGTFSGQQVASATPSGSPNRLRVTVTTADAAVAASDIVFIEQRLEGLSVADLRFGGAVAKPVILQFGVKAPAGTYCVTFINSALNRSYVAEYTIAAGEANTDVVKSVSIPGDATGTWLTDTNIGLTIRWGLMAGTTYQQAAGSWGANNAIGSSNQFNFMGTNGNVFELFDVGLYEGAVAPAFQVPAYGNELALCQRYYNKFLSFLCSGYAQATAIVYNEVPIPQMRAAPTATFGSFTNNNANNMSLNVAATNHAVFQITVTATGAAYSQASIFLTARL